MSTPVTRLWPSASWAGRFGPRRHLLGTFCFERIAVFYGNFQGLEDFASFETVVGHSYGGPGCLRPVRSDALSTRLLLTPRLLLDLRWLLDSLDPALAQVSYDLCATDV